MTQKKETIECRLCCSLAQNCTRNMGFTKVIYMYLGTKQGQTEHYAYCRETYRKKTGIETEKSTYVLFQSNPEVF